MSTATKHLEGLAGSADSIAQEQRPRPPLPVGRILIYLVLTIGMLLSVGPFLWMLSTSFMTQSEASLGRLFPQIIQWKNYPDALASGNFIGGPQYAIEFRSLDEDLNVHLTDLSREPVFRGSRWLSGFDFRGYVWNSVRITGISVLGTLLFCIPAAYAFARMNFLGKNVLFGVMLSTMMIPGIVTLVPNLLTVTWMSRLGEAVCGDICRWTNNWPALTVPFFASAFTIFLLRQFFAQIPTELWDAAQMDGSGHLRFLLRVVIPLSRAPIMTVILLSFIGSWNALQWPLLVTQDVSWRPVALGLTTFVASGAPGDFHLQMAASVMMIIPILAMYFIAQKQFTEGIAQTGLKG